MYKLTASITSKEGGNRITKNRKTYNLEGKCGVWAQFIAAHEGVFCLTSPQMRLLTPVETPARTDAEGKSASHTRRCN